MLKPTILCVDDEIDNLEALERLFRTRYKVLKANSGAEAIELLRNHPEEIHVILSDQRMPEMTGVELLESSLVLRPESIRMLLTGYTDIQSVVEAVNVAQIYRYLTKPWDPTDLLKTIESAVEKYLLLKELKEKNSELEKANKELSSLDQAKNQFMILINHELKTPLTSILSFTELLRETHLNEEQELCRSRIDKSAQKLKTLIDDVLIVVSGETKTLKLNPSPFVLTQDLILLNTETIQLIKTKNLKIDSSLVDRRLIGDAKSISQILTRLIHNAAKYGNDRSEIEIEMSESEKTPHRMKVSVRNSGKNIADEVVSKIMRPFFIDENVMNHSVGMGLGLTVCQCLLKAQQSGLVITNTPSGVEVSFELPCL